jgi:hypothetical protein
LTNPYGVNISDGLNLDQLNNLVTVVRAVPRVKASLKNVEQRGYDQSVKVFRTWPCVTLRAALTGKLFAHLSSSALPENRIYMGSSQRKYTGHKIAVHKLQNSTRTAAI